MMFRLELAKGCAALFQISLAGKNPIGDTFGGKRIFDVSAGMIMRITVSHVLSAIAVMSFVAPVAAGSFEDAAAAYEAGDYVTAFRLQLPLAEEGYAKAQVNLGMMYAYGRGVPQNDVEAVECFRRAADQSAAFAQHNLGVCYDSGRGVPLDHAEAVRWFRKAADQGLADAQYDLGGMYAEGRGANRSSCIHSGRSSSRYQPTGATMEFHARHDLARTGLLVRF